MSSSEVTVEGCGCRYRHIGPNLTRYEHLCDNHKDEYILKLYNAQSVVRQMRAERQKRVHEKIKEFRDKKDKPTTTIDLGPGSGSQGHPDKGNKKQ